ncbi:MAG: NADP-dependent phosphogluconate dehydrogenase, partial [Actinomycetota bacterium]|nr:NADP-dependent phosphogluconate dehydrogenase [Actinomycetota bacterium]
MRIGMIGLGRMGASMTLRLVHGGHEVVGYEVKRDAVERTAQQGGIAADSIEDVVGKLEPPRAVWVMVPAGEITAKTIDTLATLMDRGDAIVDGGNSRYTDTMTHASALEKKGLALVDAGTSGGIWGLREGYCLMVGSDEQTFARLEPIFKTLAPEGGYAHVGPPGAGHFTKMVHNGVEYGLMQAYGEGFELLKSSSFDLDLAQIAELWR